MEAIDTLIVAPVWHALEALGEPYRLVMAMDHRTPVTRRGHTGAPVPIAWLDGPLNVPLDSYPEAQFDEAIAPTPEPDGSLPLACHLMDRLLRI